jgi:uncharacterized protein (TIGR00266 family)
VKHEIQHQGAYSILAVDMLAGDSFKAVSGALMAKSACIDLSGTIEGGPIQALKRSLLSGEKMFFQTLTAEDDGEVLISPPLPGDIEILPIEPEEELFLHGGCLLATFGHVNLETLVQKVPPGLLTGQGLFVLKATGNGKVAISSFGALRAVPIAEGDDYMVDNGHLIAWKSAQGFKVEKSSSGWMSSFMSGEAFLWRFAGPAELWLQTRNPHVFSEWVKHLAVTG